MAGISSELPCFCFIAYPALPPCNVYSDDVDHRQQGESALHSHGEGHAAERAGGLAVGNAGGANTSTNAFLMMLSEPLESSDGTCYV